MAATVVLSLAVLVATWSAYQAALWGGVQAANASQYAGQLTEASEVTTLITAQFEADSQAISTWLIMAADGNERGMQILEERFDDTLRPAFDAWMAGSIDGDVPPGVPQDLPEYEEGFAELLEAKNFLLHRSQRGPRGGRRREPNQRQICARHRGHGVGDVLCGSWDQAQRPGDTDHHARVAGLLFAGAFAAMLSLPQQPVSF